MARLERSPEVVYTEIEDGAVLLDMQRNVYYSLNDVGTEVWRRIDETGGSQALAEELTRLFDVDMGRSQEAVAGFLEQLRGAGLVSESPGDEGAALETRAAADAPQSQRPFSDPVLAQHDEPLHEVATSPFDAQLPLAE